MIDKEALFAARLDEADVEVPGVGTVRVRALSRVEVMTARKTTDEAGLDGPRVLTLERKMLAAALVEPKLTEAEVGRWQAAARAGELDPVVAKVQELSGMGEGADKSRLPASGAQPGG